MVRNYRRKSDRKLLSPRTLKKAKHLVAKGHSIREAGLRLEIDECTLRRRLKAGNAAISLGRFNRTFSRAQEDEIAIFLKGMDDRFYGLPKRMLGPLVYQFAVVNKFPHSFNETNKSAGRDWIESFMKRNGLSLRSPQKTSVARAMGFNKPQVDKFLDKFFELLQMCKITDASKQVYNMDESGLNTVPDDKEKIISEKNKKHVGKISSAERGTTVTVIACINAAGNVLPPAFVFPRVRKNPAFLHGMVEEYPQCKLFCNESGYSNSYIFLEWMKHFIAEVRPSKDFPVILLLDNHASHLNYDALVLAKANSVHMITIPPHSSHKVQPLDVGFFAPLKTYWAQAVNDYLMLHPGETVDIKKVCSIFKPAFKKVLHPDYGKNAFKETGLWPFDRNKFTEKLFLPSMVTDQNLNEQDLEDFSENEDDNLNGIDELPIFENDVEAPRGSQVVIKAVETIPQSVNFEPMMEIPETSQQDLHDVVPQTFDLDIPVLYEEDLDEELHSQLTKFDAISNPSDFVNIIDITPTQKLKIPKNDARVKLCKLLL